MSDHPTRDTSDVRKLRTQVRLILHLIKTNVKAVAAHEEKYMTATKAETAIESYYTIERVRRDLTEALSHFDTA